MKTNQAARRILRIRTLITRLALGALLAMNFWLGESLVGRIGYTTGVQTNGQPVPNVNFSDWTAAGQ